MWLMTADDCTKFHSLKISPFSNHEVGALGKGPFGVPCDLLRSPCVNVHESAELSTRTEGHFASMTYIVRTVVADFLERNREVDTQFPLRLAAFRSQRHHT